MSLSEWTKQYMNVGEDWKVWPKIVWDKVWPLCYLNNLLWDLTERHSITHYHLWYLHSKCLYITTSVRPEIWFRFQPEFPFRPHTDHYIMSCDIWTRNYSYHTCTTHSHFRMLSTSFEKWLKSQMFGIYNFYIQIWTYNIYNQWFL